MCLYVIAAISGNTKKRVCAGKATTIAATAATIVAALSIIPLLTGLKVRTSRATNRVIDGCLRCLGGIGLDVRGCLFGGAVKLKRRFVGVGLLLDLGVLWLGGCAFRLPFPVATATAAATAATPATAALRSRSIPFAGRLPVLSMRLRSLMRVLGERLDLFAFNRRSGRLTLGPAIAVATATIAVAATIALLIAFDRHRLTAVADGVARSDRMFPDAYHDDAEAAAEFHALTDVDLVTAKSEAARSVMTAFVGAEAQASGSLWKRTASRTVTADADLSLALMRNLTDLRLMVADRLGIENDDDDGRGGDTGDRIVYWWLGETQERLVTALASDTFGAVER